jgi:putative tricarboxylic transport membrane protein
MEALRLLMHGFQTALTLNNLLFCLIGVTVGQFIGVLPGLGPVAGMAILIPLTYGLEPTTAIIMLSGIFYAAMYGGTITSVLINTPGESASAITCLDGYQMARQGRAGAALGIAAIGSFVGGVIALICLTFFGPPIAKFAVRFGPPEFFSIMMFGLILIVGLMGKSVVKGMIAAIFGLLLSLIGQDPATGVDRFTFGQLWLLDGVEFVVLAMGIFGISEILINAEKNMDIPVPPKVKGFIPPRAEWAPAAKAIGRGTLIGMLLGLIPGASASVASLMSYSTEKKVAKDPSRFGKGAIEGVAGPETANNAFAGAAMIPLLTLGIPSSPTVALLIGAFTMHGLIPGPLLYEKNPTFLWGLIASMFIGNVVLLIMNLPMANMWAKVARIPYKLLGPLILLICMVGVYSVNRMIPEIALLILFGVVGYFMKKLELPGAAVILAFILGNNLEYTLVQTLSMSKSGLLYLFQRPISGVMMSLCLLILVGSIISQILKKRDMLATDQEV